MKYSNGNASIEIEQDGTRILKYKGELNLEFPLNIDIRVSSKCAFGFNPITKTSFCTFCHESARTDGKECDYDLLKSKLKDLPKGIELAIGCNHFSTDLYSFLYWCKDQDYISNLTINQGHLKRDALYIMGAIENNLVKGLGVSYRDSIPWSIPDFILEYENTVFHTIAGIDKFKNIEELALKNVRKVLILGEKDFGFNTGKVNLNSASHLEWKWKVRKLFDLFDIVSFDNLALEQLQIKRFFKNEDWEVFNQGEHSMYIDAVNQFYAPSSRDSNRTDWTKMDIKTYFKTIN